MTKDDDITRHMRLQCLELLITVEALLAGLDTLGEAPESSGLERPLSLLKRMATEARDMSRTLLEQMSEPIPANDPL